MYKASYQLCKQFDSTIRRTDDPAFLAIFRDAAKRTQEIGHIYLIIIGTQMQHVPKTVFNRKGKPAPTVRDLARWFIRQGVAKYWVLKPRYRTVEWLQMMGLEK